MKALYKLSFIILLILQGSGICQTEEWTQNYERYIQYYTNARYTQWEAEGTPSISGIHMLHKPELTDVVTSDGVTYLKLKESAAAYRDSELVYGPYYAQEAYYFMPGIKDYNFIQYCADFHLKLEHYNVSNAKDNLNDTICVIQVTESKHKETAFLPSTDVIVERVLRRRDFVPDQFQSFMLYYDLSRRMYNATMPENSNEKHEAGTPAEITAGQEPSYTQFKVIWKGNSNYLLSIDKVIVSDMRGRTLKGAFSIVKEVLTQYSSRLYFYNSSIVDWFDIGEPGTIDRIEPVRIIREILKTPCKNNSVIQSF